MKKYFLVILSSFILGLAQHPINLGFLAWFSFIPILFFLDILINSISDKIDMILGGASPIAMAFYSEEIVSIFDKIYNGIDKNNNNIIEYNLGEGCLNYLNSISVNNK